MRIGQLFPHSPSCPIFLFLFEGIDNREHVEKIQTTCFIENVASVYESFRRKSIFIGELANVLHIHVASSCRVFPFLNASFRDIFGNVSFLTKSFSVQVIF